MFTKIKDDKAEGRNLCRTSIDAARGSGARYGLIFAKLPNTNKSIGINCSFARHPLPQDSHQADFSPLLQPPDPGVPWKDHEKSKFIGGYSSWEENLWLEGLKYLYVIFSLKPFLLLIFFWISVCEEAEFCLPMQFKSTLTVASFSQTFQYLHGLPEWRGDIELHFLEQTWGKGNFNLQFIVVLLNTQQQFIYKPVKSK